MKQLTLTICAIFAVAGLSFAGTEYSSKETHATETPACPTWFADNEFNFGAWGAVGFAADGDDDDDHPLIVRGRGRDGTVGDDTGLLSDTAFGGGLDAKYFFARYFGIGASAFGLFSTDNGDGDFPRRQIRRIRRFSRFDVVDDDDDDHFGALLGTFTFRYPIPCSRFAPYLFLGAGGAMGANDDENRDQFRRGGNTPPRNGGFIRVHRHTDDQDAEFMGQVGAGLETRITPHIGWTADLSWNFAEEDSFGMFRSGLNFAF